MSDEIIPLATPNAVGIHHGISAFTHQNGKLSTDLHASEICEEKR